MFNDSYLYLASEKYSKATFKGTVSGFNLNGGKQKVRSKGDWVLHGVTRTITSEETMEIKITLLPSIAVATGRPSDKSPESGIFIISPKKCGLKSTSSIRRKKTIALASRGLMIIGLLCQNDHS
jgi:hypothetical protein